MSFLRFTPAEAAAHDRIESDYTTALQLAQLPLTLIDVERNATTTPDECRRALLRQLQSRLPKDYPPSIRAEASPQMPADIFARAEAEVKAAITHMAHASPTLVPVEVRDRTGRRVTEFYGAKSAWMNAHKAPLQIMKGLGAVKYEV